MEYTLIIIFLGAVLMIVGSINELQRQVCRLNTRLDKISKHLGIEEPDIDEELLSLIAEGKRVKAVKRLRDFSGMGLREAKEYVDKL